MGQPSERAVDPAEPVPTLPTGNTLLNSPAFGVALEDTVSEASVLGA